MSSKELTVNCPNCKKQVVWNEQSTYRPFCSERCQQIDLGEWASESYAIPAEPDEQWSGDDTNLDSNQNQNDYCSTTENYTLQ